MSGFASVVGAGAGEGWKTSTDSMGGAHGGVSPGADDNAMPGFNGGGNGSVWMPRRKQEQAYG